jgi:hypothetical protein
MLAHDDSMLGVVDLFPSYPNLWRLKDWKDKGKWKFLGDFRSDLSTSVPT